MNIYLAGHPKLLEFANHFNSSDNTRIVFTSEDDQDYGHRYSVRKEDILQIESNDEGTFMIWWMEPQLMQGHSLQSSCVFKDYQLL
jgi:hypothetical protein